MRTTAANVAARVAAGGDDMLSKWQLLAERNKQRSEGGDGSSGSAPGNMLQRRPSPKSGKDLREEQEAEKRGYSTMLGSGKLDLLSLVLLLLNKSALRTRGLHSLVLNFQHLGLCILIIFIRIMICNLTVNTKYAYREPNLISLCSSRVVGFQMCLLSGSACVCQVIKV